MVDLQLCFMQMGLWQTSLTWHPPTDEAAVWVTLDAPSGKRGHFRRLLFTDAAEVAEAARLMQRAESADAKPCAVSGKPCPVSGKQDVGDDGSAVAADSAPVLPPPAPAPLPDCVRQWSTRDVCLWLQRHELAHWCRRFKSEHIDGVALLKLTDMALLKELRVECASERAAVLAARDALRDPGHSGAQQSKGGAWQAEHARANKR